MLACDLCFLYCSFELFSSSSSSSSILAHLQACIKAAFATKRGQENGLPFPFLVFFSLFSLVRWTRFIYAVLPTPVG
jgi:hypothetical protein